MTYRDRDRPSCSLGSGNGEFDSLSGAATDAAGNIYVADRGNHRIQKFGVASTPTRTVTWGRLKSLYR